MAKFQVMNSTIGFRPAKAAPTPTPAKPCSVIGVSMTRRAPNSCKQALRHLVGALVFGDLLAHDEDVSSRRISSAMASRRASRTVMVTISVPSGTSGSATVCGRGGSAAADGALALAGIASGACGVADSAAFCSPAGAAPPLPCGAALAGAAPAGAAAETSSPSPARIRDRRVDRRRSRCRQGRGSWPRTPSSTASTSMVALSVSISAITSPGLTLSPSLLEPLGQLALLHRGREGGHEDVGRHGTLLIVWRSGVRGLSQTRASRRMSVQSSDTSGSGSWVANSAASLTISRTLPSIALSSSSRHLPFLEQPAAHLLDRVALLAHLADLFLGAVFGRVGHGVAAVAVGQHLEDDTAPCRSGRARSRVAPASLHGAHVHAVDLLAGDVEGQAALGEVGRAPRRGSRDVPMA